MTVSREMNLREYVEQLPEGHRARKQYNWRVAMLNIDADSPEAIDETVDPPSRAEGIADNLIDAIEAFLTGPKPDYKKVRDAMLYAGLGPLVEACESAGCQAARARSLITEWEVHVAGLCAEFLGELVERMDPADTEEPPPTTTDEVTMLFGEFIGNRIDNMDGPT